MAFEKYIDEANPSEPKAPTGASAQPNTFGKYIEDVSGTEKLGASLKLAEDTNPDDEAKRRTIGKELGIPHKILPSTPEAERMAQVKRNDPAVVKKESPGTATYLENEDNAKVSLDDVDTLRKVEGKTSGLLAVLNNKQFSARVKEIRRTSPGISWDDARALAIQGVRVDNQTPFAAVEGPKATVKNIAKGLGTFALQEVEKVRQSMRLQAADFFSSLGGSEMPTVRADIKKKVAQVYAREENARPSFETKDGKEWYGAAESAISSQTSLLAAVATRNPTIALGVAGVSSQAPAYLKYSERGGSKLEAFVGSTLEGALEIVTEKIPVKFITEGMEGTILKRMLSFQAAEQTTEQVATLTQDFVDYAVANPNKTIVEYLAERPEAARQTFMATLLGSGTIQTLQEVALKLAPMAERERVADRATNAEAGLRDIGMTAQESKTRDRSSESFQEFVNTMTEDGDLNEVYLDSKVAEQLLANEQITAADLEKLNPSILQQIEDAQGTNTQIAIPMADYLANITGTPLEEIILSNLRVDPDGMSFNEAKEFYQTQAEVFAEQLDQVQKTAAPVLTREEFETAKSVTQIGEALDQVAEAVDGVPAQATPAAPGVPADLDLVRTSPTYEDYLRRHENKAQAKQRERDEITDTIVGQFTSANRYTGTVNKAFAAPLIASFEANAARMGLSPLALYNRLPVKIQNIMDTAGNVFNQDQAGLAGAPENVTPYLPAHDVSDAYVLENNINAAPVTDYVLVDRERAALIAEAYEQMEHNPNGADVKEAYDALVKETLAQYEAILKTGLKIEFIPEGAPDPYATSPRLAIQDVRINNHLWVFPTSTAFGTLTDVTDHPLLAKTKHKISGKPALANDIFRIVHDYFGHIKEGVGFRADGEENAWRIHSSMYTPLARKALTTETRGQNSWVNFGPYGEQNRRANAGATIYADQKVGLLPDWIVWEGSGQDPNVVYQQNAIRDFDKSRIGRKVTDTPEFKAWFGNSQVVDANGEPLRVFHGTAKDFDVFSADKAGFNTQADNAKLGFFFTDKARIADIYSGLSFGDNNVMPVYLKLENPLRLTAQTMAGADQLLLEKFDDQYDGAIIQVGDGQQTVYMVRTPTQIKSAVGNNGNFDPANPNIVMQSGKPGEVAVRGVHYSREQRNVLSGRHYGTGIKGAEADRVRYAKDSRLKSRLYFYVDEGNGTKPEGGVGRFRHDVELTNMYDASANPLGFPTYDPKNPLDADGFNVFESAVLDAGFDGYYVEQGFGQQGVAVILGDASIEVQADEPAFYQTASPENQAFKKWIEGSQVVDEEGKPLVVYHGTEQTFDSFELPAYFTEMADEAGAYTFVQTLARREKALKNKKYREAKGVDLYAGTRLPYTGYFSEITKPGVAYATDEGIAIKDENGKFTVFTDLVVQDGTYDGDTIKVRKGDGRKAFRERQLSIREMIDESSPEGEGVGGNIVPVYLSIKNPKRMNPYEANRFGKRLEGTAEEWEKAVAELKAEGYDGIVTTSDDLGFLGEAPPTHWIPLDREQIKSAVGNNGNFDPNNPNILNQSPIFYSQLKAQVELAKVDNMPAAQWKAWLNSNAPKLGIKKAEIEATGLTDWLDLQQGKISKATLLGFLDANGVTVEETMLGLADPGQYELPDGWYTEQLDDDTWVVRDDLNDIRGVGDTEIEAIDASGTFSNQSASRQGDSKYNQYTVPGGENYKELLLTLPPTKVTINQWRVIRPNGVSDGLWDGEENAQRRADLIGGTIEPAGSVDLTGGYRSSHFDQANILAHVRFDERTDAEGNKVLFLHEIQSDWGQEGKKKGFADKDAKAYYDRINTVPEQTYESLDADQRATIEGMFQNATGIPTAPFVTDTKAWVALALKRMMRYAAENDYAKIAIINGKQAAGLYDLAKQVDEVRASTYMDGTYGIYVFKDGEEISRQTPVDASALEGLVGKDLAAKIIAEGDHREGFRIYEGLDLQVGGEGMKTFYDQIVPQVANDVLKKLGGGKVETVDVTDSTGDTWGVWLDDIQSYHNKTFTDKKAAQTFAVAVGGEAQPLAGEEVLQTAIAITPELRDTIMKGLPLFQNSGPALGSFNLDNLTISLLKGANLSTVIHESGHFYLKMLQELANMPEATDQIRSDYATTLAWFGVTKAQWESFDVDQMREYHEQWAQSWELWNLEGKAPSSELQPVFSRFRAWLLSVYKSIEQFLAQNPLAGKLNDEVRQVFSRMIAAEQAIVDMNETRSYLPLFATAEEAKVPKSAFDAYIELGSSATSQAIDDMQARSMRDMKWLSNAKSRAMKELQATAKLKRAETRDKVAEEVMSEPVNVLRNYFKDPANIKMDAEVVRTYAPDLSGLRGMTQTEGVDPDILAQNFGFSSGEQMINELLTAENANDKINGITDQRMLEENGELVDEQSIDRAANEAVHNEARARFMATGLKFLTEGRGDVRQIMRAAKSAAEQAVNRKLVRDLRPKQYQAAETRANKEAIKEAPKNPSKAAEAQRSALLNNRLASATADAVSEVEKALRYLAKFNTDGTRKNLDEEYLDQIDGLLEPFDLRKGPSLKSIDSRATLLDWIAQQEALGFEPVLDPELVAEARRKSYKNMTMEEFRGLIDAVKQIEHLGRLKKKLLTAKDQREFDNRINEAKLSIDENRNRVVPERETPNDVVGTLGAWVRQMAASHRKFASYIRELDGGKDLGVMADLLLRPMFEAGQRETDLKSGAADVMADLFTPIMKNLQTGFTPANISARKRLVPGTTISMTHEQRIMFGMNWGNEGNRQRLLDGGIPGKRALSSKEAQAILDTLTKDEWDFIQNVWNYISTYKPLIAEQERKVTGKTPEWIEPAEVKTKFGVYPGGYFPAKYDTILSTRSDTLEAAADLRMAMKGAHNRAAARNGYVQKRAEEVVNRPILLSFSTVSRHLNEVIHRLAWQDWLIDASRVIKALDPDLRSALGAEALREIQNTVRDVADGDAPATGPVDVTINRIRTGTSIAAMGWKVSTALLQPSGISQSWSRIGGRYVARGVARAIANPIETNLWINENSTMMSNRAKTMNREVNEIMNTVRSGSKVSAVKASFFGLVSRMQRLIDVPTYVGAYERALDNLGYHNAANTEQRKAIEEKAHVFAGQTVIDTQTGGEMKDLAGVQRGTPAYKLFTNFYSYFSTLYNLNVENYRTTDFKDPAEFGDFVVNFILLNTLPAIYTVLLKNIAKGDCEWDDLACIANRYKSEQLSMLFGQMVLLREVGVAADVATGGDGFGYSGPAGLRVFADLYKTGQQVEQGDADLPLFKALNNVAGILFHYPAGQLNATIEGMLAIESGEVEGIAAVKAMMFGPPK